VATAAGAVTFAVATKMRNWMSLFRPIHVVIMRVYSFSMVKQCWPSSVSHRCIYSSSSASELFVASTSLGRRKQDCQNRRRTYASRETRRYAVHTVLWRRQCEGLCFHPCRAPTHWPLLCRPNSASSQIANHAWRTKYAWAFGRRCLGH
jgi:hypothetical protein